jgi:hypothetical protein
MVQGDQIGKKYPSDLTDEQWASVAPDLLPRLSAAPRTLINCLNTGFQKARKYRGMGSESV